MRHSDWNAFVDMLSAIADTYGKKLNPNLIGIYFKSLEHCSLDDVSRAFNLHVRNPDNGQFFPKPADLIRLLDGDTMTQGMRAWSMVLDAVRRVGGNQSVIFDDPVIHRVITDMGGWPKICEHKVAEEPFVAKEFEKRYSAYTSIRSTLGNNHAAVLLGISDAHNLSRGFELAAPILVGNSQKALDTMRLGSAHGGATQITAGSVAKDAVNSLFSGRVRRNQAALGDGSKRRVTEAEALASTVGTAPNWKDGETF